MLLWHVDGTQAAWCAMQSAEEGVVPGKLFELLQQLSWAYSCCMLCVEGPHAATVKLGAMLPRLHAAAAQLGMRLQCFLSQHATFTQVTAWKLALSITFSLTVYVVGVYATYWCLAPTLVSI